MRTICLLQFLITYLNAGTASKKNTPQPQNSIWHKLNYWKQPTTPSITLRTKPYCGQFKSRNADNGTCNCLDFEDYPRGSQADFHPFIYNEIQGSDNKTLQGYQEEVQLAILDNNGNLATDWHYFLDVLPCSCMPSHCKCMDTINSGVKDPPFFGPKRYTTLGFLGYFEV